MGLLLDSNPVPSIRQLPPGVDGEGLEISGWAARFDELDAENEQFHPVGMAKALDSFLKLNPVVLLNHKRSELPYGKVVSADVRPEGVFVRAVIPKAVTGKAAEVYQAVKDGLLRGWSLGGLWSRMNVGGQTRLFCNRIVELSLASIPTSEGAVSDGIAAVVGVKAIGDNWVPVDQYNAKQREALNWLQTETLRRDVGLIDLRASVASLRR